MLPRNRYGLLLNELCQSPVPVMDAIMRLVQGALALDTGTVTDDSGSQFNSGVLIILYIIRLGARIDNYLSFLIQVRACIRSCCLACIVCF